MANEKITCKVCHSRFVNNPEKHRSRPKYCPTCRTPYGKPRFSWRPNLDWIRQKLERRREREETKIRKYRQRARHKLRAQTGSEPSHFEVEWEVIRMMVMEGKLTEDKAKKMREQLR